MRHLLLTLLVAATAFAQPLYLQPERPVAAPRIGPLVANLPRTATNGTTHLLIWDDQRPTMPAHRYPWIYVVSATLVDASGNVLHSPSLVLPLQGTAIPFWNGREYVVITAAGYVRISAAGELLDPVARAYPVPPKTLYSATWTGERLLVIGDHDGQYPNDGCLYDASMNLIRGKFPVDTWSNMPVATNGDSFMLAEVDDVIILDRDGNFVARKRVIPWVAAYSSLIASDGVNYLFVGRVFADPSDQRYYAFKAISVTPAGVVRSTSAPFGVPMSGTTGQLMWDGDAYRLVFAADENLNWPRRRDARSVTIDRDANNVDGDGTVLKPLGNSNSAPSYPDVVAGGRAGSRLLCWAGPSSWSCSTYADTTSFSTTASTPFVPSRGALPEETPAVATAGDVSLLVWREPDKRLPDLFALLGVRVDRGGRVLDPTPIRIGDLTCDAVSPVVTTDGTDFFVAWQMPQSIRAMRIAHDGTQLDPYTIVVSVPGAFDCDDSPLAVASNGSSYLVAWSHGTKVYGTRVSKAGTLLDPLPLTISSGDPVTDVHAASNGHEYFVAWTDKKINWARSMPISADGTLLDAAGIPLLIEKLSGLYWSGSHYVALSIKSDGVVSVRVTSPGFQRIDWTPGIPPGPATNVPIDARVECSVRGCFSYALRDGVIYETRIDDRGPTVTYESRPLAAADPSWRQVVVFGEALKNVAYLRLAAEPEYGTAWHLFLRSSQFRGRPVR